jgi:hypothetical protein
MTDIFNLTDGTSEEKTYLRVDEQSTYIDVFCDGYIVRIYGDTAFYAGAILLPDLTVTGYLTCRMVFSTTNYYINQDPNTTIEIIEQTSTRVRIRIVGNWYETGGPSYRDADDIVTYVYTFYADRFTVDFDWIVDSDASVGNYVTINNLSGFNGLTDFTNEVGIYENSGSESTGTGTYSSADYMGFTADEMNIQLITLFADQSSDWKQYTGGDEVLFGWNNCTIATASSPYKASMLYIIDSADREYGTKKYTETERLEMGDQYKDLYIGSGSNYWRLGKRYRDTE